MDESIAALAFARRLINSVLECAESSFTPATLLLEDKDAMFKKLPNEFLVSKAVQGIINANFDTCLGIYEEIASERKIFEPKSFRYYAMQAVPEYFPTGYKVENFLAFCAAVCGVVVAYCEHEAGNGSGYMTNAAADIIGHVLIGHIMTKEFDEDGGWDTLICYSEVLAGKLETANCLLEQQSTSF